MIPVVLKNAKDQHFMPVFSDADSMAEFGTNYSRLQADMFTAIELAKNSSYPVEGIVLNVKTDPFFLGQDLYPVLRQMATRLTDVR